MPMIIWGAFFMTNLILTFVLHNMQLEAGSEALETFNMAPLYIGAAGAVVAGYLIPRMFLAKAPKPKDGQDPPFFTALVIRLGCFEVVGILGFATAMNLKSIDEFYPFMLTSVVLMILTFPTAQKQQDRRL